MVLRRIAPFRSKILPDRRSDREKRGPLARVELFTPKRSIMVRTRIKAVSRTVQKQGRGFYPRPCLTKLKVCLRLLDSHKEAMASH